MASYMGSGTARLVTSAEARAAAGEAPATIRIRNLQSVVRVGTDAWGRHGRTQPILVSAEVGLKQTFGAAANSDSVSADTVHYGTLTKAILGFLEENFGPNVPPNPTAVWTLKCALEGLWARLTGLCIFEILLGGYPDHSRPPVLNATQLRSLAITFHLPKASLAGDGVSLTAMCVYGNRAGVYSMSLCLHNLRQRTLIGVNPNERLAKQVVGTTVEIDKYTLFEDEYATLENLVVETIEPTAFETLEALATHTAKAVLAGFKGPTGADAWRVKIQMEKPTAITFADCPVIEVVAGPEDLA